MTSTTPRGRAARGLLAACLVAVASLVAAPPADAASDDYQQVVDLTFPFEEGVDVRYRDDYDAKRSSERNHQATDMMVPLGTPVYAAVGGTVSWISGSRSGPPSYGWIVNIAGDDGRTYAYIHLGRDDWSIDEAYGPGIRRGARVERGQLVGWAGCSGSAGCGGGEHLHFEIHDDRVRDPYDYHEDQERINPYRSLVAAERRGDYPEGRRFLDVSARDVHAGAIEQFADRGVTKGCNPPTNNRFCPLDAVTRQQMASFLTRALDLRAGPGGTFTDVNGSNQHRADIAALARAGITKGCNPPANDRFCPGDVVTRQQMASFLTRALDLRAGPRGTFTDVNGSNQHRADIAALARAGITKGCNPPTNDRFCPGDVVTRQQMASFVIRALDR